MNGVKVKSSTVLVTGSPEGPVYNPPGRPVELDAAEAKDLINRGLAEAVSPAEPTEYPATTERESEGAGQPMQEAPADSEVHGDPAPDAEQLPILRILNGAEVEDLTAIKGVGKKTAADIVASRDSAGPFASIADAAARVGGVSVELLAKANASI